MVIPIDAVKSTDELTCRLDPRQRQAPRTVGEAIKARLLVKARAVIPPRAVIARLNRRYGRTVVSVAPWTPPPGDHAGGKISYTRIPRAEDFT